MPLITLNFSNTVQCSVQINDVAYYVPVKSVGGYDTKTSDIVKIGTITSVGLTNIIVDADAGVVAPRPFNASNETNDFIMFSKDNKANMANMLGYYASVEYRNNSTDKAELFATSVEVHESSK